MEWTPLVLLVGALTVALVGAGHLVEFVGARRAGARHGHAPARPHFTGLGLHAVAFLLPLAVLAFASSPRDVVALTVCAAAAMAASTPLLRLPDTPPRRAHSPRNPAPRPPHPPVRATPPRRAAGVPRAAPVARPAAPHPPPAAPERPSAPPEPEPAGPPEPGPEPPPATPAGEAVQTLHEVDDALGDVASLVRLHRDPRGPRGR